MLTEEDKQWILSHYEINDITSMANYIGCCTKTITNLLRSHGITRRVNNLWNRDDAEVFVRLYNDPSVRVKDIAAKYRVCFTSVYGIAHMLSRRYGLPIPDRHYNYKRKKQE